MTAANNAAFIWSIANLLRGPYKPAEYGPVILPFTVLRRLDCVLESTKAPGARQARRPEHQQSARGNRAARCRRPVVLQHLPV